MDVQLTPNHSHDCSVLSFFRNGLKNEWPKKKEYETERNPRTKKTMRKNIIYLNPRVKVSAKTGLRRFAGQIVLCLLIRGFRGLLLGTVVG